MTENKLEVAEIFGPTIQGEGPLLGTPTMFVRTQYCPVGCSFCDTKYTWSIKPELAMTIPEIYEKLVEKAGPVRHCVISGGEPFAQAEAVAELSTYLWAMGWEVEIETSGTFMPSKLQRSLDIQFNVSPKPPSAQTKIPPLLEAIKRFTAFEADFKFVVKDQTDFDWVVKFCSDYGIRQEHVYFMPEGITPEETAKHLRFLWEVVPQKMPRARVTPRMHIDVWGPKRGV